MKILIAEDDAVSRRLLEATLAKWGNEVVSCANGEEAWRFLQKPDSPKLLILDWMMPRLDGVELCRRVRKQNLEEYVYIILLTAKGEKEDLLEGLEAGADDYITKPFILQELKVRIRAGRRILELQEALIAARERMRDRASHDALTGLLNRAGIEEILIRELQRAVREGHRLALAMADLDHFKGVNDTYGHMAGDAVLREVAARMTSSLRSYDAVARYGGEEFLMVLPGCDLEKGKNMAERIRKKIAGKQIDTSEGMIQVSISIGVADSGSITGEDPESLLRACDAALYRAKERGRNQVRTASELNFRRSEDGKEKEK
jgi:two-component system cell cycle response regulator